MQVTNSVKFTVSPSENVWSQILDFTPTDGQTLAKKGRFFACLSIKPHDKPSGGIDFLSLGREVASRLQEEYYKSTLTAFTAMKGAVETVVGEYENLSIEIAAGSLLGNVFYACAVNGASVFIYRDGSLATVLESKKSASAAIASGYPNKGDRMVFATSDFTKVVATGALRAALAKGDLQSGVELLASARSQKADGAAAHFLEFDELTQETVQTQPSEEDMEEDVSKTSLRLVPRQNFFKRVIVKAKNTLPDKSLYIKRETPDEKESRRNKTISLGIIILVLLIVSIGFGIKQKNKTEKNALFEEKLTQAEHLLSEAEKIALLNPARARELFSQSRSLVKDLQQENIEDSKLSELTALIEERETKVLGEHTLTPELFVDLSLLAEGFVGSQISVSTNFVYVFDEDSERVIEIIMPSKRSRVVAGPSIVGGANSITNYATDLYLVKGDGIYLAENNSKVIETALPAGSMVQTFAGNIYVLTPRTSEISRYSGAEGSFSSGASWFAEGISVNLDNAVSWAIDGFVWILEKEGALQKFSNGLPQIFELAPVYPEIKGAQKVFTSEESDFLYILDTTLGRIFVFDKEGGYKSQYVAEGLKNAHDFVVFESEGIGIFLTGEKLEMFSLN